MTIYACCRLYNIAKSYQDPEDNLPENPHDIDDEDADLDDAEDLQNSADNYIRRMGQAKRQDIVTFVNTRV